MDKLVYCDVKISYGFYDVLRLMMETLDNVCNSMLVFGCVIFFFWKIVFLVFLIVDLVKVGFVVQIMKFYRDQNMSIFDVMNERLQKEMEDKLNGFRSEAMIMFVGWFGRVVGKVLECKKEDEGNYGMEDVFMGVLGLIKFIMMEGGLVVLDMVFVEYMEMMISMDDKDSVMRMVIEVINKILVEYKMYFNYFFFIRIVVKEVIQMGDSIKMLQFFYVKMIKVMLKKIMEKMGLKMKMDEEVEEEMDMEMQRWMIVELGEKVREMMFNMTKMVLFDYIIFYLFKLMEVMKMKKWVFCVEFVEIANCLQQYVYMILFEF